MNAQERNQAFLSRMKEIKELFDGSGFQDQLEEKQRALFKETSNLLKTFSPENFLDNFDPENRAPWANFIETGVVRRAGNGLDEAFVDLKAILATQTKRLSKAFEVFERWQAQNRPAGHRKLASDIDLEADLTLLNTLYPYNVELGGWMLPDFTLRPDNPADTRSQVFSGLCLCLDFKQEDHAIAITVKADKTKASFAESGHWHPHVSSSGRICWGEGDDAAEQHWENKRLIALFHTVCSIFGTYNSGSPYSVLENWISREAYFCSNCGVKVYDGSVYFIDGNTEVPACNACCKEIGRRTGVYKWNHELVYSNIRSEYILKRDASQVWLNDEDQDFLLNVLANPNFSMCHGGCFQFVHNDYLSQHNGKSMCIRCLPDTEE